MVDFAHLAGLHDEPDGASEPGLDERAVDGGQGEQDREGPFCGGRAVDRLRAIRQHDDLRA